MPRFFVAPDTLPAVGLYRLEGENGRHAVRSLRVKPGEALTLCDGAGTDYKGTVTAIEGDCALLSLEPPVANTAESRVLIHLFQCLPKADKLELVIQKAVELGVHSLTPVISRRCIASMGGREEKKLERWGRIALEAAKQSGRGIVPRVLPCRSFQEALGQARGTKLFLYEGGGLPLPQLLSPLPKEISLLIGPEGGFSPEEAFAAAAASFTTVSLGPRILRTETAPLAALSAILYEELRQSCKY